MAKHHYVAQFYQKGFTDPHSDGLVWVYDRQLKTYKRLPPKVVCCAKDFYAVKPEGAATDQRIETDILGTIEQRAAPIIRKIESQGRLTHEEMAHLAIFVAIQYARVPTFAGGVKRAAEAQWREKLRLQFLNVDRAKDTLERDSKVIDVTGLDPEGMVKYVSSPNFSVEATERPFLEMMFHIGNGLAQFIANSDWTILIGPVTSAFITSDNAFVPLLPRNLDITKIGSGYGVPGTVNYFPLTKRTCLELRYGDTGYRQRNVDGRFVRTINRNIAATAERFIIGSSERQMRSLVRDCAIDKLPYEERVVVEIAKSNENESLIKFARKHPPKYFYPE